MTDGPVPQPRPSLLERWGAMANVDLKPVQHFLQGLGSRPATRSDAIQTALKAGRSDVVQALQSLSPASYAGLLGQIPSPAQFEAAKGSGWTAPAAGPLDLDGPQGRQAVAWALRGLLHRRAAESGAPIRFNALRATTDELGITHVRLAPTLQGLPVLGEQVVAHISPSGQVSHTGSPGAFQAVPPRALLQTAGTLIPSQVQEKAKALFGQTRVASSGMTVGEVEPVYFRDPRPGATQGSLRKAFKVQVKDMEAQDLNGRTRPSAMNYVIDAQTGACLRSWNRVCGTRDSRAAAAGAAAQATARPGQIVAGSNLVSASMVVAEELVLDQVRLDFGTPEDPGLRHGWRGDVVVEVQSPGGTVHTIAPFAEGDDGNDLYGAIDLGDAFAGEGSQGTWRVTVKDRFPSADDGEWRFVHLQLRGRPVEVESVALGSGPVNAELPAESTLTVNATPDTQVARASLALDLDHPASDALQVRLTSEEGRSIVRVGPGPHDLSTVLKGAGAAGSWKLSVVDPTVGRQGTLKSWTLKLDLVRAPDSTPPPPRPNAGDDVSPFTGTVQVPTSKAANGRYQLRDGTRGGGIETRDARGQSPNRVEGRFDRGVPFESVSDRWGGASATEAELTGMETQYFAAMMYDFLKEVFGFDSLDNRGRAIRALANVGIDFSNAFWFEDMFHVGTGDGRTSGRLSTVDIVGHELAHGVTDYSAGLIYEGESGGLNEGTSDILGVGLEWFLSKRVADAPPFDWKVGEDTWTPSIPGDALRNMRAPREDGVSIDHYADFRRGMPVHFSSGIANRFFHLLVEGGTHSRGGRVDGLKQAFDDDFDGAMQAGLRIWFRALQYYMTPSTDFAEARDATERAARDLYPDQPDVERNVSQAWEAVGVRRRGATLHAAASV